MLLGYITTKEYLFIERRAKNNTVDGKDVFALLKTGFGKSLI